LPVWQDEYGRPRLFVKLSEERFVYTTTAIAALSGLLFGYDTGVISGAILFIKKDFSLSSTGQEIVVGSVLVGAVLGASIGGEMADRFGRRITIIVNAAVFSLASIGTAFAPNVAALIAGRVVVGLAIGVASLSGPLYISEVSPNRLRGSLVSLNQLALTSGIVLAYLVDFAFASIRGWRIMLGLGAVPATILGVAMLSRPRSPRWLMSRGRVEEARATLREIEGREDSETELRDIRKSLEQESGGMADLLAPFVRPALMVGAGLAILQQVTGINTVIYYAPTIFQGAGFSQASHSILATLIVGVVNVGMTIVAIRLIDRVGRRPLLLVSLTGMVFGLTVLGLAFAVPGLSGVVGWAAVAAVVIYVGSFAIGLGPVFWLLISEIYPLKVRGIAMSTATVANWGANLVVAMTFLTLVQFAGRPGTFWIYAVIGVVALVFIHRFVPETKGRSLEEIERHWHRI
jgi:SP family galactose:H+ symporter-like MFS transporter